MTKTSPYLLTRILRAAKDIPSSASIWSGETTFALPTPVISLLSSPTATLEATAFLSKGDKRVWRGKLIKKSYGKCRRPGDGPNYSELLLPHPPRRIPLPNNNNKTTSDGTSSGSTQSINNNVSCIDAFGLAF